MSTSRSPLASVVGIFLAESPYRETQFDLNHVPEDRKKVYQYAFLPFVQATLVIDTFAGDRSARHQFWSENGLRDHPLVKTNPLKWGTVGPIVAMLQQWDIPVRVMEIGEYSQAPLETKLAYFSEVREVVKNLLL